MPFAPEDIRANRDYFAHKLRAEKQKNDVIKKVKGDPTAGDFLLLDVRPRDAFAKAHIAGAFSAPLEDSARSRRSCRRTGSWSPTAGATRDT